MESELEWFIFWKWEGVGMTVSAQRLKIARSRRDPLPNNVGLRNPKLEEGLPDVSKVSLYTDSYPSAPSDAEHVAHPQSPKLDSQNFQL